MTVKNKTEYVQCKHGFIQGGRKKGVPPLQGMRLHDMVIIMKLSIKNHDLKDQERIIILFRDCLIYKCLTSVSFGGGALGYPPHLPPRPGFLPPKFLKLIHVDVIKSQIHV